MCGPVACGGKRGVLLAIDADGWMDGWMVVMLAVEPGEVKRKKKKKRFTYADGWWSTRTDGWCVCGPVACGGRRGVFVARMDGWMVVVLAVEPGDVKKKKKKEKKRKVLPTRMGGGRCVWVVVV